MYQNMPQYDTYIIKCKYCNKIYKYLGLLSKHENKCDKKPKDVKNNSYDFISVCIYDDDIGINHYHNHSYIQ